MEIRFAKTGDIPGILELLRQVGEVHHKIRPDIFPAGTLKYDEAALCRVLEDPQRPVFVADAEGRVVGYCFCVHKHIPQSPTTVQRQELYIDDLCVDEKARRKGIARGLYTHALEYGKTLGCHTLTLNVWCGNEEAQSFYREMGMQPRNVMMEFPLEERYAK